LALVSQGAEQHAAAKEHFVEALRIRPAYPDAHNNLGGVLYMDGRRAEAIAEFREALRLRPDFTAARDNLRIAESPPR
jgi:Tfp pilus assembly protein PilF